eukprot:TRINITY_DN77755_c0_g1_i1.p1 TRINITY_DN77755_c0_g1~~TRINITY_DN77755_c0_g1_i1.p1  ORF type:complete len:477 (-),score=96.00 TRINITY_DN77755_c0_g1_i1:37-1467(-)
MEPEPDAAADSSQQATPARRLLNPGSAEFLPASLASKSSGSQSPPSGVPESLVKEEATPGGSRGSSLIFGGGGTFLSKYAAKEEPSAEQAKLRKRGNGAKDTAVPDRINIQLNQQIVNSRSPDRILEVVSDAFDQLNEVNLITALHRLASQTHANKKATVRRDPRFKRLIQRLGEAVRSSSTSTQFKPQDLSNIAWALTKLGILNMTLFNNVSELIVERISEFEPVNLSMTLWAFARSGVMEKKLFRAAIKEAKARMPDFQPQQVANTAWAVAKSGFIDQELFTLAAEHAIERLDTFQPMNFSMLLYSFALAKQPHPRLFDEVGKRCTTKALSQALSAPHAISNLALAYSEAGIDNPGVFEAMAQVAADRLYDFSIQQVITLAQAFATAQIPHEKLFKSLSSSATSRLAEFRHVELQELLGAFKALDISTKRIDDALAASYKAQDGTASPSWNVNAILMWVTVFVIAIALGHRKYK